jgi:hypothetical protein
MYYKRTVFFFTLIMRYSQELVNCVSECLCREISRALMIGNSLGLTSFAFPTKPG